MPTRGKFGIRALYEGTYQKIMIDRNQSLDSQYTILIRNQASIYTRKETKLAKTQLANHR